MPAVDEADLQVFIDGTMRYFVHSSDEAAVVNTPYLVSNSNSVIKEFTGIIGVTGHKRGNVYFTAPRPMLKVLLMNMGETDLDDENLCDLVGEVANTISGNARREFGKDFMISVPVVIVGEPERIVTPERLRSFVIPIKWRSYEASLVISIE